MEYKLLKKYPGLPCDWEEGMILGQGDRGSFSYYTPCSSKYTIFSIKREDIVNNPEFWKKVEERDYEIVALHLPNNPPYKIVHLSQESCIKRVKNGHRIHSVKRLSDGEVFTVGDTVRGCSHEGCIDYFQLEDEKDSIIVSFGSYGNLLGNIYRIEPILVTKDCVDIFEGDTVSSVLPKGSWQTQYDREVKKGFVPKPSWLYFSTRERAEAYIENNRPQYSKKQIRDAFRLEMRRGSSPIIARLEILNR